MRVLLVVAGLVVAAVLVSGGIIAAWSVLTAGDETGVRDPRLGRNEKGS